ncbi:MAG: hypothetical protein ACPHAS_10000 [Synechococcus sp.]
MIAREPPPSVAEQPNPFASRAQLRLQSIAWAVLAGLTAGLLGLLWGLEPAVRSGGCGLFYGLLAFHLQRVDPDDSHLQAGLVGAVCGIRSLGMAVPLDNWHSNGLTSILLEFFQAWLPLIGSAVLLQVLQRVRSASRP